jgi:hypothetical protein
MKTSVLSLCVVVCAAAFVHAEEYRTFTNTKGVSIKAKLVGVANGSVTIEREGGQQFTLPIATLSAADQKFLKTAATSAPARSAAPAAKTAPGPNDKLTAEQVNAAVGAELFGEKVLWESAASEVAERFKLREESKTKAQSSYRLYPRDDLQLFGAHPYSVALYADNERVTSLSLVFANKGDLFGAKGSGEMHFDKDTPPAEAAKIVRKAMDKDIATISAALTKVLGEPKKERFGERGAGRMNMQRWDWRGHSILLADAESEDKEPEYVGVQIVTSSFADAGGKVAKTSDAVIREHAKSNIEARKSGDVVIMDIPMVDQGPKGYCVPATAERAMRFMGLPADMYVLANAGGTGYGGGTSVELLLQGVGRVIRAKSRSFDSWTGEMKLKEIARHIDKGIPVIWALFSTKEFNDTANKRTEARKQVSDWAQWKKQVTSEAASNVLEKDKETAHVVLITGYNKDTNEIAFSDSWGERFKERWITLGEAQQVSQNYFYVIGF